MKDLLLVMAVIIVMSCSSSNSTLKIGNYTYKVKTERVNTGTLLNPPKGKFGVPGDFSTYKWVEKGDSLPIISLDKMIYFKGKVQCGCTLRSQRMGLEQKNDSIFSEGEFYVYDSYLICIEKYFNGLKENSLILRVFKQQSDGHLKLEKYVHIPSE